MKEWLYIAKGITIILVVIGHFSSTSMPNYFIEIKKIIYTFHMPLFFILSGFLYSYSKYSFKELVILKVRRLVFPFISVSLIFFIVKYIGAFFVHIKTEVTFQSFIALLINPLHSYVPLLWFVYALFFIFIIYHLSRTLISNEFILFLLFFIIALLVNIAPTNSIVDKIFLNIPFFISGIIAQKFILDKPSSRIVVVIFYIVMYICIFIIDFGVFSYFKIFILGLLGAFSIIVLSQIISRFNKIARVFIKIGIYSMSIYLLHPIFLNIPKIFLEQIIGINNFEIIFIFSIIAGIIFPYNIEIYFIRKYNLLRKYILGINEVKTKDVRK